MRADGAVSCDVPAGEPVKRVDPGAAALLAGASLRGDDERAAARATLLEQGGGTTSPIPSTGRFPRAMVAASRGRAFVARARRD
jgi:hypothetical protein